MINDILKKIINVLFVDGTYGIAIKHKKGRMYHTILPTNRFSYADPFVIEHQGKKAVFVELMDYHYGWGTIGVFEIEEKRIKKPREIIREKNHMSFPNIFQHDEELYMMPETYGASDVHLYRCVSFPYKWERLPAILEGVQLVDHAIYNVNNMTYVVSYDLNKERSRCFIMNWEDMKLEEFFPIGDFCLERPGGSFFAKGGNTYRVIQDCHKTYGDFIRIYKLDRLDRNMFEEHQIRTVRVDDYKLSINRDFQHTHQYSMSENYEVIDFYYQKYYWNKLIRFLTRVILHPGRRFR